MNIQVFALEHDLRVNGKAFRRWDQLRESSHTMMQLLHEHREQTGVGTYTLEKTSSSNRIPQTMSIPMVFLGHGVGGLIIKDVRSCSNKGRSTLIPASSSGIQVDPSTEAFQSVGMRT